MNGEVYSEPYFVREQQATSSLPRMRMCGGLTTGLSKGEEQSQSGPGKRRFGFICRFALVSYPAATTGGVVECVFGKYAGYVYTIEFQKRDLPHAHLMLILQAPYKPRNRTASSRRSFPTRHDSQSSTKPSHLACSMDRVAVPILLYPV